MRFNFVFAVAQLILLPAHLTGCGEEEKPTESTGAKSAPDEKIVEEEERLPGSSATYDDQATMMQLETLLNGYRLTECDLHDVPRDNIVEHMVGVLRRDCHKVDSVRFRDERGGGVGVVRDFFSHLGRKLSEELMEANDEGSLDIKEAANPSRDLLAKYRLLGAALAMGGMGKQPMPALRPMAQYLWKALVRNEPQCPEDMPGVAIRRQFTNATDKTVRTFGYTLADGSPVNTLRDLRAYLDENYCRPFFTNAAKTQQRNAMVEGFRTRLPPDPNRERVRRRRRADRSNYDDNPGLEELLSRLSPGGLGDVLAGHLLIDIANIVDTMEFEDNIWEDERTWLRSYVSALSQTDIRLFLNFATGTDGVPAQGFNERSHIRVDRLRASSSTGARPCPTSSTCFLQIHLPEYDREEDLRQMITWAIHGSQTFDNA